MNAPQELVPFAEVILANGTFVTVYQIKAWHLMAASDPDSMLQIVKLITLVTKFDDKSPTMKQVLELPVKEFNKVVAVVNKALI